VPGLGGIEERGEGIAVADVQRQRGRAITQRSGEVLGRWKVDVADRHARSSGHEPARDRTADPVRPTRDGD
jgi:hypothetical protein